MITIHDIITEQVQTSSDAVDVLRALSVSAWGRSTRAHAAVYTILRQVEAEADRDMAAYCATLPPLTDEERAMGEVAAIRAYRERAHVPLRTAKEKVTRDRRAP